MFWKQGKLLNLIKFYKYSVVFAALLTGQPGQVVHAEKNCAEKKNVF